MPSYRIGHVPKSVVVTFCVGYVTSYGRVWFLYVLAESSGDRQQTPTSQEGGFPGHEGGTVVRAILQQCKNVLRTYQTIQL